MACFICFNQREASPLFWLRINSYLCLRHWLLSATMMWCVQIGQQTLDSGKRGVLRQGPCLCLNDSMVPLKPLASATQDEWMNGCYFHNTGFFAKWRLRRLRGHFNWPFSTPIKLRPLNAAGGEEEWHLLPKIATQRVKERQGSGMSKTKRQRVPLCWRWWMSGSQHVSAQAFAYTVGVPQMTWQTAQLTRFTCTCPTAGDFTQQPFENSSTLHDTKIGQLIPVARHAC